MNKIFLVLALLCVSCVGIASAGEYVVVFDDDDNVHVNQTFIHDPTKGNSVPWDIYIMSGCIGLILLVISLVRQKTQRMDYEINIILSVMSWPFLWYWSWGGITSVDYIVGFAGASMSDSAAAANEVAFVTQHIIYNFWLLGLIGVVGSVFAIFVTALLASQYNLFRENEDRAVAEQRKQQGVM
jgi:hypothetical protein